MHIGNLILTVICSGKLKGYCKQSKDKIPFVHRLVPHIRDTLVGQGVILTFVKQDLLAEGWLGVALSQSRYKDSAAGLHI